jgi:hypothetical protein
MWFGQSRSMERDIHYMGMDSLSGCPRIELSLAQFSEVSVSIHS